MKAYTKSRRNVTGITKLGGNQRTILYCLRVKQELSFTELLASTGLGHVQVVVATRQLVESDVLEYVWSKDGRAVYRLKGTNHGT